MTEEKTTIGEAAGLVPAAKLAEVEDARLMEAAASAKLREDLEARDVEIADLKVGLDKAQKERATAVKAREHAETEGIKAKGEEAGYKREIARLVEANTALSQEVDQLRVKGGELWESLTTSNKVRNDAVKRSEALQVEMDEAQLALDDALAVAADTGVQLAQCQSDINAIAEFLKPVLEPLTIIILEATQTIMAALMSPKVQAELERLQKLKAADESEPSLVRACLNCATPTGAWVYCPRLAEAMMLDGWDETGETTACEHYTQGVSNETPPAPVPDTDALQ